MALRALNSVVAANYNKLSADPILAGDIVALTTDQGVNPPCVKRAIRADGLLMRAQIVGVCADDALGTNPYGEVPTMINNDPAGSNFVNGSTFQSYTTGFYVGAKRAIGDFKDEGISVVTNLTAGVPTFEQRGVTVYNTPGSQFVTDRFALATVSASNADAGGAWTPAPGDLVTWGSANTQTPSSTTVSQTPNTAAYSATSYNGGLLVKWVVSSGKTATEYGQPIGRVDYYDSGAGLLYWTLV